MLPFLESKRRSVSMLDASIPPQEGSPFGEKRAGAEEENMKHMALKALAGHMMSAFKSGSVEELTESLHTLCEVISYKENSTDY